MAAHTYKIRNLTEDEKKLLSGLLEPCGLSENTAYTKLYKLLLANRICIEVK